MLIGVTGLIGSGKSTATKILRSLGGTIIDADRIGRDVVENNAPLQQRLARHFGADIVDGRGRIRRDLLAKKAFSSRSNQQLLNRLVHPPLLKELHRQVKIGLKSNSFVVIDAALLLDWKLDKMVDLVLVIHASRKNRLSGLKLRGIIPQDALAREKRQLTYQQFRARADSVIFNNGTESKLRAKLVRFLKKHGAIT